MTLSPATITPRTQRVGVLLAAAATIFGAALTACAGDEGGAACPLILDFDGREYHDARADRDSLPRTQKVGTGELPDCGDTDEKVGPPEKVEVWLLKGVDQDTAVAATLGGEPRLFVAEGPADVCDIKYTRC